MEPKTQMKQSNKNNNNKTNKQKKFPYWVRVQRYSQTRIAIYCDIDSLYCDTYCGTVYT